MKNQDYNLLSKIVDALGKNGGIRALAAYINQQIQFDDYFVLVFKKDNSPIILSHAHKTPSNERVTFNVTSKDSFNDSDEPFSQYVGGTYLLDPFYEHWRKGTPDGFFLIKDIAPDHFQTSEYFLTHFNQYELSDEGGFLFSLNDEYSMHFSLGRKACSPNYTSAESKALEAMLPLIKSTMTHVFNNRKPDIHRRHESMAAFHKQLENIFLAFGTSILTKREIELVRLSLKGYSAKTIGQLLNITTATAQSHTKNIYRKLKIGSHQELFGLFLEALGTVTQSSSQDPLVQFEKIGQR